MQQRDNLIGRLKYHCIQKGRMEFGVKIPGTVEEAVSLNKKNSNSLCQDYIEKEKKNSRIPFKLLYRNGKPPVVYTKITCHLVFDLKLDMKIKP